MRATAGAATRTRRTVIARVSAVTGPVMFAWLAVATVAIVRDQISLLPPRPPTPAEVTAAPPRAKANWRLVYASLFRRLPDPPPELGSVWATRTGRICGLVSRRESGVDSMTPFYTVGLYPLLRDDDQRRYFHDWMDCIGDHWVQMHTGTEKAGFCASAHGRASVLGHLLCQDAAG